MNLPRSSTHDAIPASLMTAENSGWDTDRRILQLHGATQYHFRVHIAYPLILIKDITWARAVFALVLVLMQISVWLHYKNAVEGVRIQPEVAFVRAQ